jgi:hypothetical protein
MPGKILALCRLAVLVPVVIPVGKLGVLMCADDE